MDESQQQNEKFEAWALVELFGHQRIAGRVTEQAIGGCNFLRVDVPALPDLPGYTRLFGQGAIYGITITTEDIATKLAANMRAKPIQPYDIAPPERRLGYGGDEDDQR